MKGLCQFWNPIARMWKQLAKYYCTFSSIYIYTSLILALSLSLSPFSSPCVGATRVVRSRLLMFGAVLEARDTWGYTAKQYAKGRTSHQQVEEVLDHHAKYCMLPGRSSSSVPGTDWLATEDEMRYIPKIPKIPNPKEGRIMSNPLIVFLTCPSAWLAVILVRLREPKK